MRFSDDGWVECHRHCHLATLRELDRIADKVDDDLTQSGWVGGDHFGHLRQHFARDLKALAWAATDSPFVVVSRLSRRLKSTISRFSLPASILEKSRMSLMISSSESAEASEHLQVFTLLGVQFRIEHQLCHANDAVHRGANFVAHIGQEFGSSLSKTPVQRRVSGPAPPPDVSLHSYVCPQGFIDVRQIPGPFLNLIFQFSVAYGGKRIQDSADKPCGHECAGGANNLDGKPEQTFE